MLAQEYSSDKPTSKAMALANFIITYDNHTQGRPYRREDCSCIVAVSTTFIRCMVWQNIMPEDNWRHFNSNTVRAVVEKMLAVAQTSLERSYSNCGSYKRLPWLSTFTLRNFWLISPDQLVQLLDLFERLDEAGLLTDEVKVQLTRARSTVAYFEQEPRLQDGRTDEIPSHVIETGASPNPPTPHDTPVFPQTTEHL